MKINILTIDVVRIFYYNNQKLKRKDFLCLKYLKFCPTENIR